MSLGGRFEKPPCSYAYADGIIKGRQNLMAIFFVGISASQCLDGIRQTSIHTLFLVCELHLESFFA